MLLIGAAVLFIGFVAFAVSRGVLRSASRGELLFHQKQVEALLASGRTGGGPTPGATIP